MNQSRPDAVHWKRPVFSTELHLKRRSRCDEEDVVLLDVSDSEGGEDSDSDACIDCESSPEDGPSQIRTQQATASRRGAGCTYTPDCQCELCDDDF
ncbi:hypothetical protein AAVH_06780 [Aphelenchoides avenae]|nr:hypothetical protein AAVH_43084 [Aphelenchus avenae]KAH7725600.1 hypothetical protein AAVH_06780 [Aphelenchus avenae]